MIIYKDIDGIGEVTISSGKGNLLNQDDLNSLLNIIDSSQVNGSVKGLLIKGDGRCFSTGLAAADVPINKLSDFFALFDRLLLELFSYPKPVVAVVDGHSIGGGLLLQCCADYVVVADNDRIKIGLPELKIGLTIDELMLSLLKFNSGGVRILQELLYSGEYVGVRCAEQYGFVDYVVAPDQVVDVAMAELAKFVNYSGKAFGVTKLRLRAHTIGRMTAALNAKCYNVFNELKEL